MKTIIENYRGFEIYFDTDYEVFQCICTEEDNKESKSFSAVKKFIDDYKKDNHGFSPFLVDPNPDRNYSFSEKKQIRIIGVRKDGRFVAKKEDGSKIQVSDYDLNDYIIYKAENEPFFEELNDLSDLVEKQRLENNARKKEILSKMNIVTLKDYKKQSS